MEPSSLEGKLKWLTLNRFFLRDDFHIRKDSPEIFSATYQAWSLFFLESDENNSMRRVAVFAFDDYEVAVENAFESAKEFLNEQNQKQEVS